MTDYIEREALLERIDGIWDCADMVFEPNDHCCRADDCASCKWRETKNAIRKIAENIPSADVRPVVRGKWLRTQAYPHRIYCSNCYVTFIRNDEFLELKETPHNYCPNCGADMREGE